MAAPVASTRQSPNGIKMDDGYQTLIVFTAVRDIAFWEKSIVPPGLDGLEQIDTTTMHNVRWRSMAPRALITMTEFQLTAAYDPKVYDDILDLINVETTVTVIFPDGSTLAFYGFLRNFVPDALEEGSQPEASITVVPTNADPSSGDEEEPVMTAALGT